MSIDSGQSVVRPGDISPAINVVNWFIVVVTALFVGTRIVTKMIRCLTIGKDDMIILFSTVGIQFECPYSPKSNCLFRYSALPS